MAFCLNGKGFSRQLVEVLCCIIDELFGDALARVELTEDGNITSTVSSDTLYVWNDNGATQDMEIALPSASSAGAGTQITVISLDMTPGFTLKVTPDGTDEIYDDYDGVNNSHGGSATGFSTLYAYFPMTFISDGNGFWITRAEAVSGYWIAI